MYKDLIYSTERATERSVSEMEERLGIKLSAHFREFCQNFGNAKFKDAEIVAKHSKLNQSSYGVREFFGVEKVGALEIENWNTDYIAFAEDAFGNFFIFKKSEMDAVYFLEHETDELDYVAGSFEDFLDGIVKANYDDLPSVKNAEVWIDPEFLKLQKDLGNA